MNQVLENVKLLDRLWESFLRHDSGAVLAERLRRNVDNDLHSSFERAFLSYLVNHLDVYRTCVGTSERLQRRGGCGLGDAGVYYVTVKEDVFGVTREFWDRACGAFVQELKENGVETAWFASSRPSGSAWEFCP